MIEPTFGLSRLVGAVITDAYREEEVNGKQRIFLKLKPSLAPVKAAVFPLQKDSVLQTKAKVIYHMLKNFFVCEFDDAGNIGKMYRRQDEIGTPLCVTVDYDTVKDDSVTIRDRDTMKQERIVISDIAKYVNNYLVNP